MDTGGNAGRFVAGDRVRLLQDRVGLKKGAVGTITHHGTIKRERSISPDASGNAMYVVFDGVIGTLTVPTDMIEKLEP